MRIISPIWKREIECVYCGCLMEITAEDIKLFTHTGSDYWKTKVIREYYINCPISGCEKDTTLLNLPTSIMEYLIEQERVESNS